MMLSGNIYIAASGMISSLGMGVKENFTSVLKGKSGVSLCDDPRVTQNKVMAGIIPETVYDMLSARYGRSIREPGHNGDSETSVTRAELLSLACLDKVSKDMAGYDTGKTAVVIASAKGNISLLEGLCLPEYNPADDNDPVIFGVMASRILEALKKCPDTAFSSCSKEDVYIISNACISGLSAIIYARRLIMTRKYDTVAVVGVDVQNRFITSGFASFKSLSPDICRPYSPDRCGLNLGEACGVILLTSDIDLALHSCGAESRLVTISGGAVSDDANHISGPSRTGDGLYLAIRNAMTEAGITASDLDMLQMHGTATLYNDEMESKAAALAGIENIPLQSLKPFFGHTLGASGVIESIIAAEELKSGEFAGTLGYSACGTSVSLNLSGRTRRLSLGNTAYCLKTASGFGGTNAAIVMGCRSYDNYDIASSDRHEGPIDGRIEIKEKDGCRAGALSTICMVEISNGRIVRNGEVIFSTPDEEFGSFIREAYKSLCSSNMKFYKMDDFCKLAYVASDCLLDGIQFSEEECAMVLTGKYGCLDTDMKHQQIIDDDGDSSASPAVFVYTLPNVAAGELSIHHHIKGENTWLYDLSEKTLGELAESLFIFDKIKYCITGRFDFIKGKYFAKFELVGREFAVTM